MIPSPAYITKQIRTLAEECSISIPAVKNCSCMRAVFRVHTSMCTGRVLRNKTYKWQGAWPTRECFKAESAEGSCEGSLNCGKAILLFSSPFCTQTTQLKKRTLASLGMGPYYKPQRRGIWTSINNKRKYFVCPPAYI
jgi:hypothetical protein